MKKVNGFQKYFIDAEEKIMLKSREKQSQLIAKICQSNRRKLLKYWRPVTVLF